MASLKGTRRLARIGPWALPRGPRMRAVPIFEALRRAGPRSNPRPRNVSPDKQDAAAIVRPCSYSTSPGQCCNRAIFRIVARLGHGIEIQIGDLCQWIHLRSPVWISKYNRSYRHARRQTLRCQRPGLHIPDEPDQSFILRATRTLETKFRHSARRCEHRCNTADQVNNCDLFRALPSGRSIDDRRNAEDGDRTQELIQIGQESSPALRVAPKPGVRLPRAANTRRVQWYGDAPTVEKGAVHRDDLAFARALDEHPSHSEAIHSIGTLNARADAAWATAFIQIQYVLFRQSHDTDTDEHRNALEQS